MIIKTASSIYEVREEERRFRRVHELRPSSQQLPVGQWYQFQRMSPVVVGQPVRFYWILGDESPGLTRIGLWATSEVLESLTDEEGAAQGEPPFLLPVQGGVTPA